MSDYDAEVDRALRAHAPFRGGKRKRRTLERNIMQQGTIEETEKTETPDPQQGLALASEEIALSAPRIGEDSSLNQLARMEAGLELLKKKSEILKQIRRQALSQTGARDWVLMRGKGASDDAATGLLTSAGALRMAVFYEITTTPAEPCGAQGEFLPVEKQGEEGEVLLEGWCDAYSGLTGVTIHVEAQVSSAEDFTGRKERKGDSYGTTRGISLGDLKLALSTRLKTKSIRELGGMKSVPVAELIAVGLKFEDMTKGSGFGSSGQRGADAAVSGDIKEKQERLRAELLARTGGDKASALELLKDITIWTGKDNAERWATDEAQLMKDFQMKKAWDALSKHPIFGDNAQKSNGGNGK